MDSSIFSMDDYKTLTTYGYNQINLQHKIADKGHLDEVRSLAYAIQYGGDWPILFWEQLQAIRIAFATGSSFQKNEHNE